MRKKWFALLFLFGLVSHCRVNMGKGNSGGSTPNAAGADDSTWQPAPISTTNLISDPGFETGNAEFAPGETPVTVARISSAIVGGHSLQIGLNGYGNSAWWVREVYGEASLFRVSAMVRSDVASTSQAKLCAFITYADDSLESSCSAISGLPGNKGVVEAELAPQDKIITMVRFRVELEGSQPMLLTLDEAFAGLKDYVPETRPGGGNGGGNGGGPGNGVDPNDVPIPPGTPYPGFTYTPPTLRPYLKMDNFHTAGNTSQAFLRLKAQVDSATAITAALPAGSNYDALVTALNGQHYGYSCVDSVVMYRLTGDVAYINQAIKMIDLFVAAEMVEINAGRRPRITGDSYLHIGEYFEQLALTFDYGYGLLTQQQRDTWQNYANMSIQNLWYPFTASWGSTPHPWSGWSMNDPGNNYFYSFLKATQLWAWASQNTQLITFLQEKKYPLLVPFFSSLTGGGTREGTGYGTALGSMFENYRYWRSASGENLSAISSHSRETIDYWVHATVPTLDSFAPIGDQARSANPKLFDYQRRLMLEAVSLHNGSDQAARGTWWLNRAKLDNGSNGFQVGSMRYNYDFRFDLLAPQTAETPPTALQYYASGAGALFARSDWTSTASWFATIAGTYDQSHAHADQGSFSFYKNEWLAVTSNIHSRNGINQGVEVQNVVRFMQNGATLQQRYSTSQQTHVEAGSTLIVNEDLSAAYNPALVQQWLRTIRYDRAQHTLEIADSCMVSGGVAAVFQIHTPALPAVQPNGTIVAGNLLITPILPANPTMQIVDMRSVGPQYRNGYRIDIAASGTCAFNIRLGAL